MTDIMKAWKCGNGHVMGMSRRNGSKVQQLLLYREAIDAGDPEAAEVDVIGVLTGKMADIRCSACGAIRTWYPGPEEKLTADDPSSGARSGRRSTQIRRKE